MVSWNLVEFFLDRIQMTGLGMCCLEMTPVWECETTNLMMCWTLALKVNGFHFIRKLLPMVIGRMVLLRCGYSWWLHGWVEKLWRCGNEEQ